MYRLLPHHHNIIKQFDQELYKFKSRFHTVHELNMQWLPNGNSKKKSREVIGTTIYIYGEDENKALNTLQHEFIDYILTNELIFPL